MEAAAAVKLTNALYDKFPSLHDANGTYPAFIHTTVMDNKATTLSNLYYSLKEQLDPENDQRF